MSGHTRSMRRVPQVSILRPGIPHKPPCSFHRSPARELRQVVHCTTMNLGTIAPNHGSGNARVPQCDEEVDGRRGEGGTCRLPCLSSGGRGCHPRNRRVCKLRWGLEGRGKRGGARVIYFFHDMEMPLLLLKAYAKNDQADLSSDELKAMRLSTKLMVDEIKRRRQGR